ncbi:MAG: hypothetical protein J6S14_12780 [Clostridia bacterium]|nr:hypothetical protein [Clostridia bacterium]
MEEKANVQEQTVAQVDTTVIDGDGGVNSDPANKAADGGDNGKETVNDSAFTDSQEDGKKDPATKEDKKEPQSKEQNAENARRRREAERQKEMRELREKTIIETLNGTNPYTGEPMSDSLDVEEYLTMREIEKNGGDPVNDYPKYRKQKERDAAAQQEKQNESEEWYQKDREAFKTEYPDVDLSSLIADEDFCDYAEGKVGKKPLSEIYRGFLKFTGKYEDQAKEKAAQYIANRQASPGALGDTKTAESDYFTMEQVKKMSPAEVHKNYEKIRKSMQKWN